MFHIPTKNKPSTLYRETFYTTQLTKLSLKLQKFLTKNCRKKMKEFLLFDVQQWRGELTSRIFSGYTYNINRKAVKTHSLLCIREQLKPPKSLSRTNNMNDMPFFCNKCTYLSVVVLMYSAAKYIWLKSSSRTRFFYRRRLIIHEPGPISEWVVNVTAQRELTGN